MMNWPTAFVIAVTICAGAFLYNKPSDAAFGGSDIGYVTVGDREWVQFDGNEQRWCYRDAIDKQGPSGIYCKPWKTN